MATVKVSAETYEELNRLAGKLRVRLKRPVSIDEVLGTVMKDRSLSPADFAGTLSLDDDEAEAISKELNLFWSKWQPRRSSS